MYRNKNNLEVFRTTCREAQGEDIDNNVIDKKLDK